jgi:predicted metal-binding membrane protein
VSAAAVEAAAPTASRGWPLAAVRVRLGLVVLLVALAGVAWWWTAHEMRGMDNGPWTGLGGLGWFVSIWVVMMAAMMFPSVAPTVALYSRLTARRSPFPGLVFAAGYLATWAAAGVVAYGIAVAGGHVAHGVFVWDRAGRWVAAGTLAVAAVYELTPIKDVCLGKCRSPLGALLGSWRSGLRGSFAMGVKNGAWCVGCCWALMASLFALGIMSIVWMAFVAALIAVEKLIPWARLATWGTAAILLAVALTITVAPHALPGLTIPHHSMGMGM